MRFELTAESQARFKRGLAATAQRLNKSSLDLLRQTAVYYAQAARKRTPGPWYGSLLKTLRFRPATAIPNKEVGKFIEKGKPFPRFLVEVWIGRSDAKAPKGFPVASEKSPLRVIKYRGAAQLSWSSMLKKLFKSDLPPATGANFANVLANGASVQQGFQGAFRPIITTENRLGYIARLRPGIVGESLLAAQNRFANAYIRKIGKDIEAEFNK